MFPVVAPLGTGTTIVVALQPVGVADVPLNVTVLEPWLAPKLVPVIVKGIATGPEDEDKPVIVGVGSTVKLKLLLVIPPTVTTT
jgi:hypothetical protein